MDKKEKGLVKKLKNINMAALSLNAIKYSGCCDSSEKLITNPDLYRKKETYISK